MKGKIEAESRAEAELIDAGLQDPFLRALVKVMGSLKSLPAHQRERVLAYVRENADDVYSETQAHGSDRRLDYQHSGDGGQHPR